MYKNSRPQKLTKKEQQLLIKLLLKSTDNGEDGQIDQGVLEYLEMMFGSPKNTYDYFNLLQSTITDRKLKHRIDVLLAKLISKIDNTKNDIYVNISKIAKAKGLNKTQAEILARKYANLADYSLNKAVDESFEPKPKLAGTGPFTSATREQLVSMFDSDKFYKMNNKQRTQLYQAVVNDYCRSKDIDPCGIKFTNLPISDKSVCFGEYVPSEKCVYLNSKVLDMIDEAGSVSNNYLPYQILSTIIHEAQHAVQFSKIQNQAESVKDFAISNALFNPQENLTYNQYLAEPDELDARNEAQQYIANMALKTGKPELKAFYNSKKISEINNKKVEVEEEIKNCFPDIYNEQLFSKVGHMGYSKAEFNRILKNGSAIEYTK